MKLSMTSRERVLCALAGGKPDAVPFAEQFVADRISRLLLEIPGDTPYGQKNLADVLGNDIVKFSRMPPMYYEAVMVDGHENIGPGLIKSRKDLPKLILPDDEEWIQDAREFLRTQRGERAAAGATRLGISGMLVSMGIDNFSMALYDDPGLIEETLEAYATFAKRTIEVFMDLGFDFIWCFDDLAYKTGTVFSPETFRNVILPIIKKATDIIEIPWIFHSDGNILPLMDDLLSLGMAGLHPIEPEAMDLAETKRILKGRACVIGNISVDLLARGTPNQIHEAVLRAFAAGAPEGGYMISSGNCIPEYALIENVRQLINSISELRGKDY